MLFSHFSKQFFCHFHNLNQLTQQWQIPEITGEGSSQQVIRRPCRVMQKVFFLGSFSAAFLYSVVPVYRIMHQHQNFASLLHLHSVHNKILLINNCASVVTDASNSAYGYCRFTCFIPEEPERNTLSWIVTYMLQYLVATKTSTWKKRLYFGLQSKKKALRETHGLRKPIFFSCFKILLKISVFREK